MSDWITTEGVGDGDWWLSFAPEMLDLIRFHTRREPPSVVPCRVFSIEKTRFVEYLAIDPRIRAASLPSRRVKLVALDFNRAQWRRRVADEQAPKPPTPIAGPR